MRPLKLIISAFGPYAGVQQIDFTALRDQIFVITGPTGAGKTTIFDAISFALFGEPSGSSRDRDSLRSDFAQPGIETFIELEFELRGRIYKIRRSPQQEQKKQRGEGFTTRNADAELFMPDDTLITKVSNVDEKINELLGINKNQFKQIVMLPQGEFRRLLEADSNERELIFRKIFGTEAFAEIQKRLEDESREIYKAVHDIKTEIDTHIKHFDLSQDPAVEALRAEKNINADMFIEAVKKLCSQDTVRLQMLKTGLDRLSEAQNILREKIIKATEINKKIKDKQKIQLDYLEMTGRTEEIQVLETKLEYARAALPITEIDGQFKNAVKSIEAKTSELSEAQRRGEKCLEEYKESRELLNNEKTKEPLRKHNQLELSLLNNMLPKVVQYEKTKKSLETAKRQYGEIISTLEEYGSKLELLKSRSKEQEDSLKQLYMTEAECVKLDKDISDNKKLLMELDSIRNLMDTYLKQVEEFNSGKTDFEIFDEKYIGFRSRLEQLEDNYFRGQAGILAKTLKTNIPCPVCGSLEHPKPALIPDNIPEEGQLKKLKQEFTGLTEDRTEKLKGLSEMNGNIEGIKRELAGRLPVMDRELENLEEAKARIIDRGVRLKEETLALLSVYRSKLQFVKSKDKLENDYNETGNTITRTEEAIKKCTAEKLAVAEEVAKLSAAVVNIEEEVPEDIRLASRLNARINEVHNTVEKLEADLKKAELAEKQANEALKNAEKDTAIKSSSLNGSQEERARLEELLNDRLKSGKFESYEHYLQMRKSEEEILSLQEEISVFYQNIKSLKDMYERLEKETRELEVQDTGQMDEQYSQLAEEQKKLQEEQNMVFSRNSNNIKTLSQLEDILIKLKALEQKYSVLGELARIARGDNNQRITFERYVLAAYFDEIIVAANLRLDKMTGSRYQLKRKEEKGKGRAQQGLELEVFDNYTGKPRHVKTLSGGEGFKASLALALGLADVVQAYSGGISLDTLFVDEGFGALDPESLDSAIQCLVDIQKGGRLVGVISHVPELKERIKTALEVFPQKEGSFIRLTV